MMRLALLLVVFLGAALLQAQAPSSVPATAPSTRPSASDNIPAAPAAYMNDYAGVIAPGRSQAINDLLKQFDKDTTNQVVVAIYRKMDSSEPIELYTRRIANAWGVGQKGVDNGVVLFVFLEDRQLYLQVGSGLEGRLSNEAAKRIIDTQITPKFRNRDFAAGVESGVKAILEAIR